MKKLDNYITKASGKNVTLRCEVKQLETNLTKNKLQFKWLQNYGEIRKNAKFRIGGKKVTNSSLSFTKKQELILFLKQKVLRENKKISL